MTRKLWVPDALDIAIVSALADIGGAEIQLAELAGRLGISVRKAASRLATLAGYGYLRREGPGGGVRYWVLRVPETTDTHEWQPAPRAGHTEFTADPDAVAEAARRYEAGASIKQVAAEYGVGATAMRRALLDAGVDLRGWGSNSH